MQKKLALTIIILFSLTLLTLSPIGLVSATPVTIATNWSVSNNTNHALNQIHPSAVPLTSAIAETFYSTGANYLTTASIWLRTYHGSAGYTNATVKVAIYTTDAAAYASAPDTLVETSSTSVTLSGLASETYTAYTFNFAGTTQLSATTYYALVIYIDSAVLIDSTHAVWVGANSADPFLGYNTLYYSAAWSAAHTSTGDPVFQVMGDTAPTTPPTPTPTATPNTSDLWNGTWIQNVVGIILPLAMILIPAFIGWKFAKAWGFFAGLNVGVILCYVYGQMIPLWGVVVMLVVDGLMLFGKLGMHD